MRSNPKVIVFCDGMGCNLETEVDCPSGQQIHIYIDEELSRRGWTYYGNLDFCQGCAKDKNHVVLKGIL